MAVDHLPIPFPLRDDPNEYDFSEERFDFWYSEETFAWFKWRGYTLYESRGQTASGEHSSRVLPRMRTDEPFVEAEYPYAYHSSHFIEKDPRFIRSAVIRSGTIMFAQDAAGRHVVIKLVLNNTDEHRICQFLNQQPMDALADNCILPILDILVNNQYSFVITPRWGDLTQSPTPQTLQDVVQMIRSMLKGLRFLHENNIIHRDVSWSNYLVNSFCASGIDPERMRLRSSGMLLYAIHDFDMSILVPPGIDRSQFRLPYHVSWSGTPPQILDTAQGEADYDPFAFDVGTLGRMLCESHQHLCRDLPLFAPLFDGMTTRNVRRRFTAEEALNFLDAQLSDIPATELNKLYHPQDPWEEVTYEKYDRWCHIPPALARQWAMFREPPLPLSTRFLRWIYSFDYMPHIIPRIRKLPSTLCAALHGLTSWLYSF